MTTSSPLGSWPDQRPNVEPTTSQCVHSPESKSILFSSRLHPNFWWAYFNSLSYLYTNFQAKSVMFCYQYHESKLVDQVKNEWRKNILPQERGETAREEDCACRCLSAEESWESWQCVIERGTTSLATVAQRAVPKWRWSYTHGFGTQLGNNAWKTPAQSINSSLRTLPHPYYIRLANSILVVVSFMLCTITQQFHKLSCIWRAWSEVLAAELIDRITRKKNKKGNEKKNASWNYVRIN